MLNIHPTVLAGRIVRLEPLTEAHVPDLVLFANDGSIWRYFASGQLSTEGRLKEFVKDLHKKQAQGTDLPFAVIHLDTDRAIGCTRYMEIQKQHRGLEIGGTWYGVKYQRTGVNTECKYLLLKHAFEVLKCIRVQLKTDLRNTRSQKAIERIGAIREGIFRHHMVMPDGHLRDSVIYSIIDTEWPSVKAHLEEKMASYAQSTIRDSSTL
jgi:RimJ/RimL family protein N-acetyltransferase